MSIYKITMVVFRTIRKFNLYANEVYIRTTFSYMTIIFVAILYNILFLMQVQSRKREFTILLYNIEVE